MGCHTWFYNVVKPKIKRVKVVGFTITLSELKEQSLYMQKYYFELLQLKEESISQLYTEEFEKIFNKNLKKQTKKLKSEIKQNDYKYYDSVSDLDLAYKDEIKNRDSFFSKVNIYGRKQFVTQLEDVEFHDCFRTNHLVHYTDTILYSKKETFDFIEKYNLPVYSEKRIHDFWDKYPNGIIKFG